MNECNWCGRHGVMFNHHWPIAKQFGGKETVEICGSCHAAAHAGVLVDGRDAIDEEDLKDTTMNQILAKVHQDFPVLWKQNYGQAIPAIYDRIVTLNPMWKALPNGS
jgi:hypothetical protein